MIAIFACHNICEVLAFIQLFQYGGLEWIVRAYYCLSVWAMAYMVIYALDTSQSEHKATATIALLIFSTIVSVIFLSTDTVIAGAKLVDYVIMAERGAVYWTFQVTVFAMMGAVIVALINGYKRNSGDLIQIQCLWSLAAITPLALVGPLVIAFQLMGFALNVTALLPLASTAYLAIIVYGESRHGLTDIRVYLPYSLERKTAGSILKICAEFATSRSSLKEAQDGIERILITYALQKQNFNVSRAARMMSVNRSTLYSACRRLSVQISNEDGKSRGA